MKMASVLLRFVLPGALAISAPAANYVALTGNDSNPGTAALPWRTIQKACNAATPGMTVLVMPGTYNEKVVVNVSGSAGNYIVLQANGAVTISGNGKKGKHLVDLSNRHHFKLIGFELTDDLNVSDGSGIRVEGTGHDLEISHNNIHNITGKDAMGITVYGTSGTEAIYNLVIDANEIYDCQPAQSETLTLNGNVRDFQVTGNYIHDVNNIGIDFIGGEGTCPVAANDAARNGVCRANTVARSRSNYGGGYGAGIYVDGGHDLVIENNLVTECDLGIEIGAENSGVVATAIVVRNNLLYRNDKVGLVFGGYASGTGRVRGCQFLNNTLYKNDTLQDGNGELWIQYADGNLVANNIFYCGPQNVLMSVGANGSANTLDYNLWFSERGSGQAEFTWNGKTYTGFSAYRSASKQDTHSLFADPALVSPDQGDLHLQALSPARNAGDPAFVPATGETDIDGQARVAEGRVDLGADEFVGVVNSVPAVNISSPIDGATFLAPASILVEADAQAAAGKSLVVEFFADSTKLGEANAAPLTCSWPNVPAGTYTLTARATDSDGLATESAPVEVIVEPAAVIDLPPTADITSPTDGAKFVAPAAIVVQADAQAAEGKSLVVEFFVGSKKLGQANTAPFTWLWPNVAAGNYRLTVKATDSDGLTTSSTPVDLTVRRSSRRR
jgi:hypothetical protein